MVIWKTEQVSFSSRTHTDKPVWIRRYLGAFSILLGSACYFTTIHYNYGSCVHLSGRKDASAVRFDDVSGRQKLLCTGFCCNSPQWKVLSVESLSDFQTLFHNSLNIFPQLEMDSLAGPLPVMNILENEWGAASDSTALPLLRTTHFGTSTKLSEDFFCLGRRPRAKDWVVSKHFLTAAMSILPDERLMIV